ncbi:MAG: hypothetical protein ACREXY_11190, partial [Gammaproteobacteria bacterium]
MVPPKEAATAKKTLKEILRADSGLARMGNFIEFYRGIDLRGLRAESRRNSRGLCARLKQGFALF